MAFDIQLLVFKHAATVGSVLLAPFLVVFVMKAGTGLGISVPVAVQTRLSSAAVVVVSLIALKFAVLPIVVAIKVVLAL